MALKLLACITERYDISKEPIYYASKIDLNLSCIIVYFLNNNLSRQLHSMMERETLAWDAVPSLYSR